MEKSKKVQKRKKQSENSDVGQRDISYMLGMMSIEDKFRALLGKSTERKSHSNCVYNTLFIAIILIFVIMGCCGVSSSSFTGVIETIFFFGIALIFFFIWLFLWLIKYFSKKRTVFLATLMCIPFIIEAFIVSIDLYEFTEFVKIASVCVLFIIFNVLICTLRKFFKKDMVIILALSFDLLVFILTVLFFF